MRQSMGGIYTQLPAKMPGKTAARKSKKGKSRAFFAMDDNYAVKDEHEREQFRLLLAARVETW
ncbi:hypothetical protein GCM10023213_21750 [Prosthecobacter algae]|uniref:Uncharacterized protein n=1 Tax=Prosthecobacter algae TaxID=1144682 RepID=A0ABP9P3G5_9BACT